LLRVIWAGAQVLAQCGDDAGAVPVQHGAGGVGDPGRARCVDWVEVLGGPPQIFDHMHDRVDMDAVGGRFPCEADEPTPPAGND
jgi:hypothetical protein